MKRFFIILLGALCLCGHAAAQTQADFSRLTEDNHPRLLFTDKSFKDLKGIIRSSGNELTYLLHEKAMAVADKAGLEKEPLKFELDASGKRLLPICRKASGRILSAAYAYRMTGKKKYLEHAESDLNTVCAFETWNPRHFLDVAEMSAAVAIGYDWLYPFLSQQTKDNVVRALKEKALDASRLEDETWFYGRIGNWNQVCNAGLVCAALAIYEHYPELSRTVIDDAVRTNRPAIEGIYGPDGAYPEGPTYWGFGTVYQVLMLAVMEDCLGTDFGLSSAAGFMDTGRFKVYARGNTGRQFNFADNSTGAPANIPMWYFAYKTKDYSLLYHERTSLNTTEKYENNSHPGFIPLAIKYGVQMGDFVIPKPKSGVFAGRGNVPMIMCRTGFGNKDLYLAAKGGNAGYLHGHMDAGSFVFEAYGVRWAADINRQAYERVENGIKELGGSLADRSQNSLRWRLFRLNCRQHNTITVNDKDHNVDYVVPMLETIDLPDRMGASFDLTGLYGDDLKKAVRTASICSEEYLEVTDDLEAGAEGPAHIRWTMVSEAEPEVTEEGILLRKKDVTMLLKVTGADVSYKVWSSDPQDYESVLKHLEDPVAGIYICGYEVDIPAGAKACITTTLKRK